MKKGSCYWNDCGDNWHYTGFGCKQGKLLLPFKAELYQTNIYVVISTIPSFLFSFFPMGKKVFVTFQITFFNFYS